MTTHRYSAVKDEFDVNQYDCEHPLCDRLHKRWIRGGICHKPRAPRVVWIVVDNTTDERAEGHLGDAFATKRDALAAINHQLLLNEGN